MVWRSEDPEGNEAAKCKYDIVHFTRGKVLDLGCGGFKAFPHFLGVDNLDAVARFGETFKPDVVADCTNLRESVQDASVDAIFSSHLLEHIEDHVAALRDWWACLKDDGYLILYLPHKDFYPNCGQPGSNPDHKHDFTPADIRDAMCEVGGWGLVMEEVRSGGTEYSFLQVFQKRSDDMQLVSLPERPEKSACVVRYGGWGDSIQASNILPELKRQGYHVTFMTTPKGKEILKHDPHIDAWLIQDDDQVPNGDLHLFWAAQAKRFDKFVQLSESVEATLLAMPGRANHGWPDSVRRKRLGINYLEWTSELAEVPYHSEARFYASREETAKARAYLSDFAHELAGPLRPMEHPKPRFNIMWCLSGSSLHKAYPHQDAVIAKILTTFPEASIVLTGDVACQLLEQGWEEEPRIRRESGNQTIRETLALAQQVDCVVGPETGVLNAVAFETVGKVIMLSHSSRENLTKHWVNTETLEPSTSCYPCHRLHYGMDFCRRNEETYLAQCQHDISPFDAFEAIRRQYSAWRVRKSMPERKVIPIREAA